VVGEVTTLAHEVGDNTVEGAALEVKRLSRSASSLLTSAEATEVLGGLGCSISTELQRVNKKTIDGLDNYDITITLTALDGLVGRCSGR
jgi:hypothetical protein